MAAEEKAPEAAAVPGLPSSSEIVSTMSDQSRSYLVRKVPLEIVLRITSLLRTHELCQVRLTCKALERALFEAFSREFFHKKQFMLSDFSLQTLVDISKHPTLSGRLTHLIIGLDHYDGGLHYTSHAARSLDETMRNKEGGEEQNDLLDSGRAVALLSEAMKGLSNLQTVDIRDFNSRTRYRDAPTFEWNSYGSSRILQATRTQLSMRAFMKPGFVHRAFKVLLLALAESGARPPNMEVILRDRDWGLRDSCFFIANWVQPRLFPVLGNLTKLHLHLDLGDPSTQLGHPSSSSVDSSSFDPSNVNIRKFLTHTPNLTWLRLNLQYVNGRASERFLVWLSQPAPVTPDPRRPAYDPEPIALPALQQLDLGMMSVEADTLKALAAKWAPTLKAISLWSISLLRGGGYGERVNRWAMLFRALAHNPKLSIRRVMVGNLTQLTTGPRRRLEVKFIPTIDADRALCHHDFRMKQQEFEGLPSEIFEKLASEATVCWPDNKHAAAVPYADAENEDDFESEMEEEEEEEDDDIYGENPWDLPFGGDLDSGDEIPADFNDDMLDLVMGEMIAGAAGAIFNPGSSSPGGPPYHHHHHHHHHDDDI